LSWSLASDGGDSMMSICTADTFLNLRVNCSLIA